MTDEIVEGTIVDVLPAENGNFNVVMEQDDGARVTWLASRAQLEELAKERTGGFKSAETNNAYRSRLATMGTKNTGLITDFMQQSDRPTRDEVGAQRDDQETGTVRVRPNVVAASIAARHDKGLLFQAPWETFADGFSEHSRRLARALSLAGVPVHLRSILPRYRNPVGEDRLVDANYEDLLRASIRQYVGQVQMAVPTPGLFERLVYNKHYTPEELAFINSRRVLSTVYERFSGVEPDDVSALNRVGQIWVGCDTSRTLLSEAGVDVTKIHVVPCPYLPNDPHLALHGRKRRAGVPRFYHVGKWEPRKEQRRILLAFMLAFKPGSAMLMLKTSETSPRYQGYPLSPDAAIEECLSDPRVQDNGWTGETVARDIVIMARRLSHDQMIALHRMGDVYVSLSRGEGFDMPAFDAKLAGNLLVYTPSGGPQTFAGPEDEMVLSTGQVPCHPFYRWPSGATYLDYQITAAARALQRAYHKLDGFEGVASGTQPPARRFAAEHVGRRCRALIEQLGVSFDDRDASEST